MFSTVNNLKNFNYKLLYLAIIIFPTTFLIGNFAINFISISISLIFIFGIVSKKIAFDYKDKFFHLLIFLFFTLLINLYFSNDIQLSLPRVLKFLIIIMIVMSVKFLFSEINLNERNLIFKIWSIILTIVIIDLLFELAYGHNILGQKSIIPGRLASFTGREMTIGGFFSAFSLILLSFIYSINKNLFLNLFLVIFLIAMSFLIGERSNFIKTFFIIFAFTFIVYNFKLKYKLLFSSGIIIIILSIINFNDNYKFRYFNQLTNLFQQDGIKIYINNSEYGAHYLVAKKIFYDNPIFGVGVKNFRVESFNKKYEGILSELDPEGAKDPLSNVFGMWTGGTTHPHQIHYELLAETGLFGYLTFFFFIFVSIFLALVNYNKLRNPYCLSGILYILVNLLPLIPSGSFFSTYTAGLFWINYSIMVSSFKS